MKRKILALAIAGALACPQVAFAARDGDGMEYVSASEGFYGSLRTMYSSNSGERDMNGKITGDGSRLGVRGTLDIGHGLTGLYRYEWRVKDLNSGDAANGTRLHYVGLKGAFGEVQFGTLWENDYNWVTAATDIATTGSGNFAPHFRRDNSLQYASPNLNGFQGSFRVMMDGGSDAAGSNDANVDEYALVARYSVRGFTVAGAYENQPDGLNSGTDDKTFWAIRGGYSQDNWAVNAWYGKDNSSDIDARAGNANMGTNDDTTTFSVAGNIDIGKVALVIIHESQELSADGNGTDSDGTVTQKDNAATIFNVNYNFTKKSRAYLAYIANDYDTKDATGVASDKDDEIRIGLRMDF